MFYLSQGFKILVALIFILLLKLDVLIGQSNSGIATYEIVVLPEEDDELPVKLASILDLFGVKDGETYIYTLIFDKEISLGTIDTHKSFGESVKRNSTVKLWFDLESDLCYNRLTNSISYNRDKDTTYLITEPFESLTWYFTGSKKIINNYSCAEAVQLHPNNEKEIIISVFYAEDIPISLGPMKLLGLPGLVVEATSANVSLRLMNFEEADIKLDCPLEGIPITPDEFTKLDKSN